MSETDNILRLSDIAAPVTGENGVPETTERSEAMTPALFVDFGDTVDDHLIPTRDIDGLVVDQVVTLTDEEGNTCSGSVARIDDTRAWVPLTGTPGHPLTRFLSGPQVRK